MKQRQLTVIAVICGAVCAICVFAFMGTVQGEANAARAEALARYGGEQIDVCVATRDIATGERVDNAAVETKLWVADLLPEGAVSDEAQIVGKTASSSILKGEVLSTKRFEAARDALDVPVGKVAVSVPAKAVQAVGGAIRPGMRVDIYATGDSTAAALAQSVTVLATSTDESGSLVSGASWITVALDPEQVQEMVTASSRYDLYFVLPGTDAGADASASADGAQTAKPAEDLKKTEPDGDAGSSQSLAKPASKDADDAEADDE